MIKIVSHAVTLSEVPDEISLVLTLSGCTHNCKGCHSPELRDDIGEELSLSLLWLLLERNKYASTVVFFGGEHDRHNFLNLLDFCKLKGFKTCLYTGATKVDPKVLECLTYVKMGPYIEKFGGLDQETTNQRLYEVIPVGRGNNRELIDITHKFWRKPNATK